MRKFTLLVLMGLFCSVAIGQQNYWTARISTGGITTDKAVARLAYPKDFKLFDLNIEPLKQKLFSITDKPGQSTVISLPNADGNMEQFEVFEASNFDPALQAAYPEIRAFSGRGITDRYAMLKLSISPQGIQTSVFRTGKENEFMEPYSADHTVYSVYRSQRVKGKLPWVCSTVDQQLAANLNEKVNQLNNPQSSAGQLKTVRLAQSCNGEYANFFGATPANHDTSLVYAAFNATLTRCNGCYEKDLAIHLNLISNFYEDMIIFFDPLTDPYTTLPNWNSQLQNLLNSTVTNANYDIGHMFGASGGGGNAGCIGCVCVDNIKGSGITSPADAIPMGDNFDIDYVAHEVGHQLGGNHTFTYANEGTQAQKGVGADITIMGYAGITSYDPAPHSIDIYHETSIEQIQNNLAGKTCPITIVMTANHPPVVAPVSNYTIPISTPFALTGSATDPENDPITYCWEQNDLHGGQTGANSVAYAAKPVGPNWLSFPATTSPTRLMPRLSTVQAGLFITPPFPGGDAICNIEALSSVSRTLNFRLTVRDNHPYIPGSTIGQTQFTDMVVTVTNTSGPFMVTSPNTNVSWAGGSSQTITWNVAGTTGAPVSCANVKISLSTDGGVTFPTVLAASTANDGSEVVTIPIGATTTARIKVESVGNIFYDMSDVNFTITTPASSSSDLSITKTDGVTTYTPGGTTTYTIVASNAGPDPSVGATVTDNFPAFITSVAWTAVYAGGATGPASGVGNINAIVNLPVGGTATFTAVCNISAGASGNLVNTATVAVPGGDTDPNPGNNSATDTDTQSASGAVTVTATAGTLGPTLYNNVKEAFDAINAGTHQGAIIVNVNANTDEGATPAVLNSSGTGSASYTSVLLRPTADGLSVVGSATPASRGVIELNGADNVTIDGDNPNTGGTNRNLTFSLTTINAAVLIWIKTPSAADGCLNNTIKNCNFNGQGTYTTIAAVLAGSNTFGSAALAANSNNTMQNNAMIRLQNGLYQNGFATSPYDVNWQIKDNIIGSSVLADKLGFRGMILINASGYLINNNTIKGINSSTTTSSTMTGIQLSTGSLNGTISNNKISDIKHNNTTGWGSNGIWLNATTLASNTNVYNNMISDVASFGFNDVTPLDNGYGLVISGGGGYNVYYNTIVMNTNQLSATGQPAAINVTTGITTANTLNIDDNLIVNTQTVGSQRYCVLSSAAASVYQDINYNDYYFTGPNLGIIGGTNRAALAAWQTGTGKDAQSISVQPYFVSATDFHLIPASNCGINAKGTPITVPAITTDIDGDTRNVTTPDIGADEFNGNADPSGTIAYAGTPYCSNAGTATVTQTGTTGGVYTASPAGLSINASTGAVNLGASTPGSYTVTYTIAAVGNCSLLSTTAPITITQAPSATIVYAGSPYCIFGGTATVTRTGTAGGTYTATPAGLTLNAATGDITLATSTPNTYTVTYTIAASGGCALYTTSTTVDISSCAGPTIFATGTLTPFTSCSGTPSAEQTFTVSAVNLSANLIITAPAGFEISTTSGSGFSGTITLTTSGGNVSPTIIYVRLSATASGTPSGNITCASTGATTRNVPVSGTVNPTPVATIVTTPGTLQVIITGNGSFCDEITWTLKNSLNATILSGGPYGFNPPPTPSGTAPAANAPFTFFIEAQGTFNDNSCLWEVRCDGNVVASGCIQGTNNGGGCASVGTLTVPNISGCGASANQTICSGAAILPLSFTSNVPGTVFNWTRNNTATVTGTIGASGSGTISGTLINTTNAPVLVTFTITPTAGGCTGAPVTATVLVNPTANAVATPSSQTICSGASITTIALSGAVSGTTYSWTRNNTATVTGIAASGTGNISGTLTNTTSAPITVSFAITPTANGCPGTPSTATVLVNPTPTVNQGSMQVIITGNGSFADEITWTLRNNLNAIILSGGPYGFNPPPTPSAIVPAANAPFTFFIEAQGTFNDNSCLWEVRCDGNVVASGCIQGTNNGGSCPSIGTLTVPNISGCGPLLPQAICSGSAITPIVLGGPVAGTVFNWTRDNVATVTGIPASGSGTISGTLTNTTNAPVTVTFTITPTANGCTGPVATATVVVNPIPNAVAAPTTQTICSGTAITPVVFTGNVSGTTYNWTRNNTVNVTGIAASGSGNISGTLTNTTTTQQTVTFTITPTANGCTGTPVTATVIVQAPLTITCPGNITVPSIVGGCTAVVSYAPVITGTPAPTVTYSLSGATTGSGNGTGSGLAFNVGVTTVTVTATNICATVSCSFTITVTDSQLPVINTQPANTTVCVGTNASFSVTATTAPSPGPLNYQWQAWNGSSWVNIAGATASTLTLNAVTLSMNTNSYRVQVIGLCTTVTSTFATLYVNALPTVSILASRPPSLLPGQLLTLTAVVSPGGGSYQWFKNGVAMAGATTASLTNLTVSDIGSYTCRYTDLNGCIKTSDAMTVTGQTSENVFIYPNPNTGHFHVRVYNQPGEEITVRVFDMKGTLVYLKKVITNLAYTDIEVEMMADRITASETYLVTVSDGSGNVIGSKKIQILK